MRIKATSPASRLAGKYVVNLTTGCWEWTGGTDFYGYGVMTEKQRPRKAHRVSYEHFVGPIPDGLEIDHLCHNRGCVRPSHLEPVTHAENLRRGMSPGAIAARTNTCKAGHDLTIHERVRKNGGRQCGACARERSLAWYYRAKERRAV